MANPAGLTLAFLQRRPQAAARAIEEIDAADGAAFLTTVPARIAAPVIAGMSPWNAARCVERLAPEVAGGLIRAMSHQDGATVLRLIPKGRVAAILEQLPNRLARDFSSTLTYPKGVVGAWMTHGAPVLAIDRTVADAMKVVRQERDLTLHHVFVMDSGRQFAGAVSIGDLLRSVPQTQLSEILDKNVQPISNRATLQSVADTSQWDTYSMLPVTGRRKQILGGLTRANLRKGLAEEANLAPTPNSQSIMGNLLIAYLVTCSGLFRIALQPDAKTQDRAR